MTTLYATLKKGDKIIGKDPQYEHPAAVLTVAGKEDGILLAYPSGGGFQMRIPKDELEAKFRSVSEQESQPKFRKARFEIDFLKDRTIENKVFAGYTCGQLWNGWAAPYFPKAEADRVARLVTEGDPRVKVWYDGEKDSFFYFSDNGAPEPEEFHAEEVEVDGEKVKAYPVGAYSWIWTESRQD